MKLLGTLLILYASFILGKSLHSILLVVDLGKKYSTYIENLKSWKTSVDYFLLIVDSDPANLYQAHNFFKMELGSNDEFKIQSRSSNTNSFAQYASHFPKATHIIIANSGWKLYTPFSGLDLMSKYNTWNIMVIYQPANIITLQEALYTLHMDTGDDSRQHNHTINTADIIVICNSVATIDASFLLNSSYALDELLAVSTNARITSDRSPSCGEDIISCQNTSEIGSYLKAIAQSIPLINSPYYNSFAFNMSVLLINGELQYLQNDFSGAIKSWTKCNTQVGLVLEHMKVLVLEDKTLANEISHLSVIHFQSYIRMLCIYTKLLVYPPLQTIMTDMLAFHIDNTFFSLSMISQIECEAYHAIGNTVITLLRATNDISEKDKYKLNILLDFIVYFYRKYQHCYNREGWKTILHYKSAADTSAALGLLIRPTITSMCQQLESFVTFDSDSLLWRQCGEVMSLKNDNLYCEDFLIDMSAPWESLQFKYHSEFIGGASITDIVQHIFHGHIENITNIDRKYKILFAEYFNHRNVLFLLGYLVRHNMVDKVDVTILSSKTSYNNIVSNILEKLKDCKLLEIVKESLHIVYFDEYGSQRDSYLLALNYSTSEGRISYFDYVEYNGASSLDILYDSKLEQLKKIIGDTGVIGLTYLVKNKYIDQITSNVNKKASIVTRFLQLSSILSSQGIGNIMNDGMLMSTLLKERYKIYDKFLIDQELASLGLLPVAWISPFYNNINGIMVPPLLQYSDNIISEQYSTHSIYWSFRTTVYVSNQNYKFRVSDARNVNYQNDTLFVSRHSDLLLNLHNTNRSIDIPVDSGGNIFNISVHHCILDSIKLLSIGSSYEQMLSKLYYSTIEESQMCRYHLNSTLLTLLQFHLIYMRQNGLLLPSEFSVSSDNTKTISPVLGSNKLDVDKLMRVTINSNLNSPLEKLELHSTTIKHETSISQRNSPLDSHSDKPTNSVIDILKNLKSDTSRDSKPGIALLRNDIAGKTESVDVKDNSINIQLMSNNIFPSSRVMDVDSSVINKLNNKLNFENKAPQELDKLRNIKDINSNTAKRDGDKHDSNTLNRNLPPMDNNKLLMKQQSVPGSTLLSPLDNLRAISSQKETNVRNTEQNGNERLSLNDLLSSKRDENANANIVSPKNNIFSLSSEKGKTNLASAGSATTFSYQKYDDILRSFRYSNCATIVGGSDALDVCQTPMKYKRSTATLSITSKTKLLFDIAQLKYIAEKDKTVSVLLLYNVLPKYEDLYEKLQMSSTHKKIAVQSLSSSIYASVSSVLNKVNYIKKDVIVKRCAISEAVTHVPHAFKQVINENADYTIFDFILYPEILQLMSDMLLMSTIWFDVTNSRSFVSHFDDGLAHSPFHVLGQDFVKSFLQDYNKVELVKYYAVAMNLYDNFGSGPITYGQTNQITLIVFLNGIDLTGDDNVDNRKVNGGVVIFQEDFLHCLLDTGISFNPKSHPDFLSSMGTVNINFNYVCPDYVHEIIPQRSNRMVIVPPGRAFTLITSKEENGESKNREFENSTMLALVYVLEFEK